MSSVPRPGDWPGWSWDQLVEAAPHGELLTDGEVRLTREEVYRVLLRLAGWLDARGVPPGRCVLIPSDRPLDAALVATAAMLSGRTPCVLPADAPASVRADLASRLVPEGGPSIELGSDRFVAEVEDATSWTRLAPRPPEDDAAIVLTSGSTGRAKAVRLSHRALCASVERFAGYTPGGVNRWGLAQSVHTVSGLRLALLLPALVGGSSVLLPPRASPLEVLQAAVAEGVTALTVGPLFVSACLGVLARAREIVAGSALTRIVAGGAASTAEERRRFAVGTGLHLYWNYGLTETTGAFCLAEATPEGRVDPGAGRPIVRVELWGEDGRSVPVGGIGRVAVYSSGAFSGYHGEEHPRGEPVLTHDLARLDGEGFLHVLGRIDRVVVDAAGNKILLDEVEDALRRVCGPACVVPAPGGGLAALVEGAAAAGWEDDLRARLRGLLPARAIPRVLLRVAALPVGAGGKVDRAAVSAWVEGFR